MPFVISYQDLGALGSLAASSGEAMGAAQRGAEDRSRLDQINARRDAGAVSLIGQQRQAEQANADRQVRVGLAQQDAQLKRDQLAASQQIREQQIQAGLAEAGLTHESGLAKELLKAKLNQEENQQQHQFKIQELERRSQLGIGMGAGSRPTYTPQGTPNDKAVEMDLQRLGHLIPAPSGSIALLPDAQQDAHRTAKALTSMSSVQLKAMMNSGKLGPDWAPFVRELLLGREQGGGTAQTARPVPPMGVMPEGRRVTGSGYATPGQPSGQSVPNYSAEELQSMTDQQLYELANDPMLMQRELGGF